MMTQMMTQIVNIKLDYNYILPILGSIEEGLVPYSPTAPIFGLWGGRGPLGRALRKEYLIIY